ncbi:secreted RxLR effector protein 161-like [Solanum lycopersicum]|uniref:secreted RxLR effector protein 161-like n=1 Tax=Solanum lycopersicum TaxID=4081 RepID=UPI0002BCA1C0|nr:uncharacterized protein LOC109119690 [Solanum lycopersicum]
MVTVRSVIALAASCGWYIFQMDVHNAFLQDGILMNLREYALGLVSELGLAGCKLGSTPLAFNHKLTSTVFDKFQVLSQYMHSPKTSHMEATLRVVRYINGTTGLGLFMTSNNMSELVAYCDSDWGACIESRKSMTGYIVKLVNALASWKAKKQNTVSRSSPEAEFRSMATTIAEIVWLKGLFNELE